MSEFTDSIQLRRIHKHSPDAIIVAGHLGVPVHVKLTIERECRQLHALHAGFWVIEAVESKTGLGSDVGKVTGNNQAVAHHGDVLSLAVGIGAPDLRPRGEIIRGHPIRAAHTDIHPIADYVYAYPIKAGAAGAAGYP